MQIPVGLRHYTLRLVAGRVIVDGASCASVCDHARAEILVSDHVPEHLRMQVAAAAVCEAWAQQVAALRSIPFVGGVS
jgi:hypothetical protein